MRHARCPHCRKPSLTCWQKLGTGPARGIPCPACGKAISVAWLPFLMLSVLSAFAAPLSIVLPFTVFESIRFGWTLPAVLASATLIHLPLAWAYCRFVPLVAR